MSPKPVGTPVNEQTAFGVGFTLYKDWELSVWLNLDANQIQSHKNVLHLMSPERTERILTIFQSPKSYGNKLRIRAHVNGENSYYDTKNLTPGWHWLKVAHRVNQYGKFTYSISIDGDNSYSVENQTPEIFENVNAYFSFSAHYPSYAIPDYTNVYAGAAGKFKNLRLDSE